MLLKVVPYISSAILHLFCCGTYFQSNCRTELLIMHAGKTKLLRKALPSSFKTNRSTIKKLTKDANYMIKPVYYTSFFSKIHDLKKQSLFKHFSISFPQCSHLHFFFKFNSHFVQIEKAIYPRNISTMLVLWEAIFPLS